MRILKFNFENKALDWHLEEITLNRITLLVGASGVGKTQILHCLTDLKDIVEGASINGVSWDITFETLENVRYIWQGSFENRQISVELGNDNSGLIDYKSKIIFEKVYCNDKLIVDRTTDTIIFNDKLTPKLSPQKSIIHLLQEENSIQAAYHSIRKIKIIDNSNAQEHTNLRFNVLGVSRLEESYNTLKKIRESELQTILKLYLLQQADKKTFKLIQTRFFYIFPQVEDIRVATPDTQDSSIRGLKDFLFIQIKEKGVQHWIHDNRISSGMIKTLIQLSELYVCAEGTVFLIDEFENSLGINCINEITQDILVSKRKLQFVLTSHHPYIIDAIGYQNWKLVTRNGNIIRAQNVDKFRIGQSKHSAFMQLIQLEEYQTGQEL